MKLEDIARGQTLTGVVPNQVVTVSAATLMGEDSLELIYRDPTGHIGERLLTRLDEPLIAIALAHRPWSFEADAASFQLACEAKRIDLAFLFDPMMAVHTANVDPLPHQITAVYESMLPRQPLRFCLADDPGAGKTIMAGLYIRELLLRADSRRILVVAPGSLVEQWRDELHEKFGLDFRVYSTQLELASPSANPFEDHPQLIVRLDQLARREDLQDKLCQAGWDLVICDEAHKLAAHYFGNEVKTTARFRFAQRLGAHTRHLLLMTATPHNGKEEDYQLFLSLLDSDRFYGKFRDGVHKVDASDLMRRMVKEELVKFDGTPLFPERKAYTVNYTLSPLEAALYESVTQYVRTEMGKADQLTGARKGSVGFALTSLQRRLASSPEAIYQSLRRRKDRLESRLREDKLTVYGQQLAGHSSPSTPPAPLSIPDDEDDLDALEQETLEEALVDQATAAQSIAELESEIAILTGLVDQAKAVVASGQDRKWDELSQLLQHDPRMHEQGRADGLVRQKKLIIFSEHRDTLNYLQRQIANLLGNANAIVTIHGGTHRDERRRVQAIFRSDPEIRVLIATDAAGEGVNLQHAHLMVNYDLPWNPNRLEQRFGRIHRIGQTEVCHLWNLVAKETREGDVYHRLLDKLAVESEALQGRVFDILGEVFEDISLKDLLLQAIRYGDQPEVRARLSQTLDHALDRHHLQALLDRNALAQETMSTERLFLLRDEMDKAEARRLQPRFVRAYFEKALDTLGGSFHPREPGRFEITHVPASIRERDRLITGRNRREQEPVLKRYDRICFDKSAIQPPDRPNIARALLMHPGHPLMLAMTDLLLERFLPLLRQGAVFVDPTHASPEPWLLVLLTHDVKSGDGSTLSRRMQFIRLASNGQVEFAGYAPHLDLDPIDPTDRPLVDSLVNAPWLTSDLEPRAIAYAASTLAPAHHHEVADRRIAHIDKTLSAVHDRLTKEIAFWTDRWTRLKEDLDAGKDVRLNVQMADRQIRELADRLDARKRELQSMRHVVSGTPVILGAALVISAAWLSQRRQSLGPANPTSAAHPGTTPSSPQPQPQPLPQIDPYEVDPKVRLRTERLSMQAVRRFEEARGHRVVDVSADKCGWDLTAYPPTRPDGRIPEPRLIEVKGRLKGQSTVCVTRNELMAAMNQADKFLLAIVLVDPERDDADTIDGPYYISHPFDREPGWGVASINYRLEDLLARATP